MTARSSDPLEQVPGALTDWHAAHPDASWEEIEAALGRQIKQARAQLTEEHEARPKNRDAVYNLFAARNAGRLEALSDAVFAFAMTLLVFDLHVPLATAVHTESGLWQALLNLASHLVVYVLSFMTLGIFWVGQQTMLDLTEGSDRNLAWINLGFLLMVTLVPFSTALLAGFPTYTLAVLEYWLNLLLLGLFLFILRVYAHRRGLDGEAVSPEVLTAAYRRIAIAQAMYTGAALFSFLNPRLSIGLIFVIQLNYVLAPRIPFLYRI